MDTKIQHIFGCSSKKTSQIAVCQSRNLIGYITSGGVVVSEVDLKENAVKSQRFFCANNKKSKSGRQNPESNDSNANAYLNLAINSGLLDDDSHVESDSLEYYTRDGLSITHAGDPASFTPTNTNVSKLTHKVRVISCIDISSDGKLLAVGEEGYQPRVLVYSLEPNSTNSPLFCISDHRFGINMVKFSPKSDKLCSLGISNDGFLNCWKLRPTSSSNKVQFLGSNKCLSTINGLIWKGNDIVVTFGLRHIRLWNCSFNENIELCKEIFEKAPPTSPTKPHVQLIKGKNVILKDFINSNFLSCSWYNEDELLVLTDRSEIACFNLYDDPIQLQKLDVHLAGTTNQIYLGSSLYYNSGELIKRMELECIKVAEDSTIQPTPYSPRKTQDRRGLISFLKFGDFFACLNDKDEIYLIDEDGTVACVIADAMFKSSVDFKSIDRKGLNLSSSGELVRLDFYSHNFKSTTLLKFQHFAADSSEHEFSCFEYSSETREIFLGDKFGLVYFFNDGNLVKSIKAHESSVNQIVYSKLGTDAHLLVTVGRDRMIQLFLRHDSPWELFQTLSIHRGNLSQAIIRNERLYVCSHDRTISVHEFKFTDQLSINLLKIISLKSTPLYMQVADNELYVSTNDRNIMIFNLDSFEVFKTFKLHSALNNDSLSVEKFFVAQQDDTKLLVTCSSTDKSISIFTLNGDLLNSHWAHGDAVVSMTRLQDSQQFCTISGNGCCFLWSLSFGPLGVIPKNEKLEPSLLETPTMKVARRIVNSPRSPPKSPQTKTSVSIMGSPSIKSDKTLHRLSPTKRLYPNGRVPLSSSSILNSQTVVKNTSPTNASNNTFSFKVKEKEQPINNTPQKTRPKSLILTTPKNKTRGRLLKPSFPEAAEKLIAHLKEFQAEFVTIEPLSQSTMTTLKLELERTLSFVNDDGDIEHISNENRSERNLQVDNNSSLLESFSNQLVALVEKKLQINGTEVSSPYK
ncbi:BA75_05129T0 [Komagataella pastoris]|uniref:BA75_05129T0 n=1 Tax=Komagataella pastoris TaxID=4922 RepID=A0A1B2JHY3_PICPA|nr:BA75_05129T0 [Komagataella pastoris]